MSILEINGKRRAPQIILYILCAAMILLFLRLFSFAFFQSDDYYYASFLDGGIPNFLNLTCEHFKTMNGRALVHFFAHITLHFPSWVFALEAAAILFGMAALSGRYLGFLRRDKSERVLYVVLFYVFMMLFDYGQIREAMMWTSAFFNYVFPAFLTFLALAVLEKNITAACFAALLAGATTEQWGAAVIVILGAEIVRGFIEERENGKVHNAGFKLRSILPFLFAVLGYGTIYLSPATRTRIVSSVMEGIERLNTGMITELLMAKRGYLGIIFIIIALCIMAVILPVFINKKYRSVFLKLMPFVLTFAALMILEYPSAVLVRTVFSMFSDVVFENCAAAVIPMIFCLSVAALGLTDKKYRGLLWGILPAVLIGVTMSGRMKNAALVCFAAYIVFAALFMLFCTPFKKPAVVMLGAAVTLIIIFPTSTYAPRVVIPTTILLSAASVSCIMEAAGRFSAVKKASPFAAVIAAVLALAVFWPTYTGYRYNHEIDKMNLENIAKAQETGVLHYNIDYDEKYKMAQMFNEPWTHEVFLKHYNIENCRIVYESNVLDRIYCGGEETDVLAVEENGVKCVPLPELAKHFEVCISYGENFILATHKGRELTFTYKQAFTDEHFTFRDENGQECSVIADGHYAPSFYLLSVDEYLLEEALGFEVEEREDGVYVTEKQIY